MFLGKSFEHLNMLKHFLEVVGVKNLAVNHLEEDMLHCFQSFMAKDAIHVKKIVKKTEKFATLYFDIKMSGLAMALLPYANATQVKELSRFIALLQMNAQYSFQNQEPFNNPYPEHLFFSQQQHAAYLSNKSQRERVAGKSIHDLASALKQGELAAHEMRVDMFFAPLNQELQPFVYNNRTWVIFSRAGIMPPRIVPVLPNQELLNRVKHLPSLEEAKYIMEEPKGPYTHTLRP